MQVEPCLQQLVVVDFGLGSPDACNCQATPISNVTLQHIDLLQCIPQDENAALGTRTIDFAANQPAQLDKSTSYRCVLLRYACKMLLHAAGTRLRMLLHYQLVDLTESQLTMLSQDLTQNHPWQPWDVHSPCCGNCLPSS